MLIISYPSWLTLITSKTARASHRSACLRSPPTGNMTQPGFKTMAGWPQSRSLSSKNPNVLQCPMQSPSSGFSKSNNPTLPDRPLHSNGDIPTPIKWLIHFCFGFNYSAHPTMTFSSSRLTWILSLSWISSIIPPKFPQQSFTSYLAIKYYYYDILSIIILNIFPPSGHAAQHVGS